LNQVMGLYQAAKDATGKDSIVATTETIIFFCIYKLLHSK
jgi:hypothetical protein